MTDKTHYRKAFNSPYLSSADIVEPTVLTIKKVSLEPDKTKKTKDEFNTAHFTAKELRPGEPLKPMILNASNSKTLKQLTGSPFLEDWVNVPVTIYVDPSVRFGKETVEGLRISAEPPKRHAPATDAQLATIQEYREAGKIKPETETWLQKHDLTEAHAKKLIASFKDKSYVA